MSDESRSLSFYRAVLVVVSSWEMKLEPKKGEKKIGKFGRKNPPSPSDQKTNAT